MTKASFILELGRLVDVYTVNVEDTNSLFVTAQKLNELSAMNSLILGEFAKEQPLTETSENVSLYFHKWFKLIVDLCASYRTELTMHINSHASHYHSNIIQDLLLETVMYIQRYHAYATINGYSAKSLSELEFTELHEVLLNEKVLGYCDDVGVRGIVNQFRNFANSLSNYNCAVGKANDISYNIAVTVKMIDNLLEEESYDVNNQKIIQSATHAILDSFLSVIQFVTALPDYKEVINLEKVRDIAKLDKKLIQDDSLSINKFLDINKTE